MLGGPLDGARGQAARAHWSCHANHGCLCHATALQKKTGEEMAAFYTDLCSKYPIISIEVRSLRLAVR